MWWELWSNTVSVTKTQPTSTKKAMLSCNDGFRPVSFLVEALDEEAER